MSIKKPKLLNNPLSWVETKKVEIQGVRLSDVQHVSTSRLRPNAFNSDFFREESTDYFNNLRADIHARGVIVPLIAKTDDTLLAGHNRLRVARELGLGTVPVQYVLDTLSEKVEQEFIIKDNLYRRQFSTEEWIYLYKKLYPDFEQQVNQEMRGGGQKWTKAKDKTEHSVLLGSTYENRITAQRIANDTGQKLSAVQKQLTKYRRGKDVSNTNNGNMKSVANLSKNSSTTTTQQPLNRGTVVASSLLLRQVEQSLRKESEKTVRQVLKKVEMLKNALEKRL
jgi:ParB-like nuclease domain